MARASWNGSRNFDRAPRPRDHARVVTTRQTAPSISTCATSRPSRSASRLTLDAYGRDLRKLADFTDPLSATVATLSAFARSLHTLAPRSQARTLSAVRQFYAFCAHANLRTDNPAHELTLPKVSRAVPHVWSEEDMTRLMEQPKDEHAAPTCATVRSSTALRQRPARERALDPAARRYFDPARAHPRARRGDKERLVPLPARMRSSSAAMLSRLSKADLFEAAPLAVRVHQSASGSPEPRVDFQDRQSSARSERASRLCPRRTSCGIHLPPTW